jgi:hypothetical protein
MRCQQLPVKPSITCHLFYTIFLNFHILYKIICSLIWLVTTYIDILYTLDSASNYSAIQKLKP